jgi:two-component system NtrC family sensor kinase
VAEERILVIDDSAEIQDVLRTMVIEPNGYHMLSAQNGEDGLRMALEEDPDLIILDEKMPLMTGLEVLRALRETDSETPVIFYTFHGSEDLVVQVFRLGVQDYVIKPFEPDEMERAVERVLEKARLRSERDQLMVQLQQANERMERQLQEMRAFYSIGRSVISLLDLEAVLTRVVEAAVFVTRAEEGLLLLIEGESNALVLRAAKNLDEKMARGLRLLVDDSLAGEVVRTGRPVVISGRQAKVATGYLVSALVYVPVRSPDRGIIGVMGVTNRRTQQSFSEHDVQLLATLSDYAAVALENARLYEQTETERRKMEAVLHETGDAVVVIDMDQRVLLCNPAACDILDLPKDVIGKPASDVISQPTLQEILRGVRRAGRAIRAEIPGAKGRTFDAHISPVENVGYVLSMQDVTHFKELDRVKSEFVSTVSHDLRTPLTTIQGYVTLLERVGPLNEEQLDFVNRVHTSVVEITELISELLDLGRIEAGYDLEMEPLHLEAVIDRVVGELQSIAVEKNLELHWQKPALSLIRGNHRRLQQVMENLIGNAIKYTPEEGWVSVEATLNKGYIVVRVADNGIGIPVADQPYIFERFYRVESEDTEDIQGTGLGLTIVKSAIEKHDGRIWVESHPGSGSAFTFVLPTME